MNNWEKNEEKDLKKSFFGLRDFYYLVKTFIDLIIKGNIKGCEVEKLEDAANRAIFRNFSGRTNSFLNFKAIFYERDEK